MLIELERLIAIWLAPTTRAGTAWATRDVSRLLRRRRSLVPRRIALPNSLNPVQMVSSVVPSLLGPGGALGSRVVLRLPLQGATIGGACFRIVC